MTCEMGRSDRMSSIEGGRGTCWGLEEYSDRHRSRQHRLLALTLLAAVCFSASGCITGPRQWVSNRLKVGPNYSTPPAPVADDWIDGSNPALQRHAADYSHWWAALGDPVLDNLVYTAYQQNLGLQAAGMRILEARAQRGIAVGSLFPQKQEAIGSYRYEKISQNGYPFGSFTLPKYSYDIYNIGIDAAWELDFWGRFRRGIEAADANMNAQIENYDDALVILQAEVAATYIQLRTAEERLALARKNLELQQSTLSIVQARFEEGAVGDLDVQQALTILGATEALIPALERARRLSQNRLCTLLGMPPFDLEAELGGPGTIPVAPEEVAVGIPAELLQRRPDVRRAERQAAAQCAAIGIAESELYPRIAVTGTIALETQRFKHLFDIGSTTGGVGPGFRWNILNYGRIKNNVRAEDARFDQLVLNYQETVLRANQEVEDAIVSFLREHDQLRSLGRSTNAAAKAVELSQLQYEQGFIDFQRLLDSQRSLVLQQDQFAETKGNVALSVVALYKALGGGWQMRYACNGAQPEQPIYEPTIEEVPMGETPPETPAEPVVAPSTPS